jgi:hypothetical protein
MKKNSGIFLTTARAALVFQRSMDARYAYCQYKELDNGHFFKMTDYWEWLCGVGPEWQIKKYRSGSGQTALRKAHVSAHNHNVRMSVEEAFWDRASQGGWFENFVLGHEAGHLIAGHLDSSAATKNFQLTTSSGNNFNIPATLEELEANYASAFLQCGNALFDESLSAVELSRRALSDPTSVSKAQRVVRLEVFGRELARQKIEGSKRKYPLAIL